MMKNVRAATDGPVHHVHKTSAVNVVLHTLYMWAMRTDPHFLHFLQHHIQKSKFIIQILHVQNVSLLK